MPEFREDDLTYQNLLFFSVVCPDPFIALGIV